MTVCDGGGGYGTNMTFSGLMVYTVTPAAGFSKRGEVPHPNTSSGTSYDSTGCGNWWTNARSEVKRSVMMDDFVYSISDRRVKVNGLSNLGSDVAVVALDQ